MFNYLQNLFGSPQGQAAATSAASQGSQSPMLASILNLSGMPNQPSVMPPLDPSKMGGAQQAPQASPDNAMLTGLRQQILMQALKSQTTPANNNTPRAMPNMPMPMMGMGRNPGAMPPTMPMSVPATQANPLMGANPNPLMAMQMRRYLGQGSY